MDRTSSQKPILPQHWSCTAVLSLHAASTPCRYMRETSTAWSAPLCYLGMRQESCKLHECRYLLCCRRALMEPLSKLPVTPQGCRVIAFDRPPYGLSERPMSWSSGPAGNPYTNEVRRHVLCDSSWLPVTPWGGDIIEQSFHLTAVIV